MASSTIVLLAISIIVLFVIGGLNIDAALGIKGIDAKNESWQSAYKYTVASSVICIIMACILIGLVVFVGYKTRSISSGMYTALFAISLVLCLVSTILSITAAIKIKDGDTKASGGRPMYCHAKSGEIYLKLVVASMCGAFMMALLFMGLVISKTDLTDQLKAVLNRTKSKIDKVKEALSDPSTSKVAVGAIVNNEFTERGTDTGSDSLLGSSDMSASMNPWG